MIGVFGVALAFGGVLVGAGALMGGHDTEHDVDHDADHELAHDVDHDVAHADHDVAHGDHDVAHGVAAGQDSGALLAIVGPLTSMRFWSFGSAAFGATGVLASLAGFSDLAAAGLATPAGAGIGLGAAWLFRQLRHDKVSGSVTLDRFVGAEASVVLPVRPGGVGKVRVATAAGLEDLTARSGDGRELPIGERVLVTAVRDGVADVTRLAGAGLPRDAS